MTNANKHRSRMDLNMEAPPSSSGEASISVLLAGGAAVGKSSIARRLLVNKFSAAYTPTTGVDMLCVPLPQLPGGGRSALMQLWDPSHLELHGHWPDTLRGADAQVLLLVCDPEEPDTLRQADEWLLRARRTLGLARGAAWLLAHKHDHASASPALGPHQLDAYCAARGLTGWHHTTAKHGRSVHEAFEHILEAMTLGMIGSDALAAPPAAPAPSPVPTGEERVCYIPLGEERLRAVASQLADAGPALGAPLAPHLEKATRALSAAVAAASAGRGSAARDSLDVAEWEECARLAGELVGLGHPAG